MWKLKKISRKPVKSTVIKTTSRIYAHELRRGKEKSRIIWKKNRVDMPTEQTDYDIHIKCRNVGRFSFFIYAPW